MELDDLKKNWKTLNEQMPQRPIADDAQVMALIERCKAGTGKSLHKLVGVQRLSLMLGGGVLLLWLILGILVYSHITDAELRVKMLAVLLFMGATVVIGGWWDYKCYCWTRDTRVDEMSVSEVSRRMVTLRRWMCNEVWAMSVWAVLFNALYFWMMGLHHAPATLQAIVIGCFVIIDFSVIYFIYKKLIYKHLNNIKANIEELEDLCNE